jgi:hypothetical protein
MMSDNEAENGMTEKEAYQRGLEFGWDNIFSSGGKDVSKIGQGIHALRDAIAHEGCKTNDHLGFNRKFFGKMMNDLYGSTETAASLTKTAVIVVGALQGKKTSLKKGDTLDIRGMSSKQTTTFFQKLIDSGFRGKLNFVTDK